MYETENKKTTKHRAVHMIWLQNSFIEIDHTKIERESNSNLLKLWSVTIEKIISNEIITFILTSLLFD